MKSRVIIFVLLLTNNTIAQDIQISFPSDTLTLYGTLSIPTGNGPFPTVILVHGSGPNDRDQTLFLTGGNAQCLYSGIYNNTIKNFKDLADTLSNFGIAVLRYDKRTYTYQTQLDPIEISPYDFIADVHAAVNYIKTRPEVDTTSIILLGHSQGANFLPIVAKDRNDISKLLALGTAARGIDTIMAFQFRDLYYICLNDTLAGDVIYNQTLIDFESIRNGTWNPNTPYLGAYPKFWRDWINITDSAVINFDSISQPTLFLQGTEDFNIPIEDAQQFETQLTRDSFDVYYLNGINHFFTTATNPNVSQVVTDTILFWLDIEKFPNSIYEKTMNNNLNVIYTSQKIILEIPFNTVILNFKLVDITGKVIKNLRMTNKNEIRINKREYINGMYFIVGISDYQSISTKIFISN